MTDKPQEPRDLIQICTDIYYECGTIKRLDELTDEALDWHNKQVDKSVNEARENEMELLDDQLYIPSCKEDCSKSEHLLHTGKYEYFEMIDNYVERRRNELANLNKRVGK